LTLPGDRFRDICALYAFMRVTDDIGDDPHTSLEDRRTALEEWRKSLRRALSGAAFDHDVLPALADVVDRHRVPHQYLEQLVDGVRRDLDPIAFETFAELHEYCYLVAGVVGLCCIHVWGYHDERAVEAAVDCGVAFQLTNILRDVGEDADTGRIYLPREELRRFACSEHDLHSRRRTPAFVDLMQFQVERARGYFAGAQRLFDYLEPDGKPVLSAMLRIYRGLLEEIERRDYDVFTRHIRVPAWRKALISVDTIVRHRWLAR
jgi:phytoene synthase